MKIIGVAANDTADGLALKMLRLLLLPYDVEMILIDDPMSPMELAGSILQQSPDLVILSHLPPVGLTPARYLVRRLRAQEKSQTIIVGRWGAGGNTESVIKKLTDVGTTKVVFSMKDARRYILKSANLVLKSNVPSSTPPHPKPTTASIS